jgi:hypothetical protein
MDLLGLGFIFCNTLTIVIALCYTDSINPDIASIGLSLSLEMVLKFSNILIN